MNVWYSRCRCTWISTEVSWGDLDPVPRPRRLLWVFAVDQKIYFNANNNGDNESMNAWTLGPDNRNNYLVSPLIMHARLLHAHSAHSHRFRRGAFTFTFNFIVSAKMNKNIKYPAKMRFWAKLQNFSASCIDTLIPSLQMYAESPDMFEHCHYRDGNSMFCPPPRCWVEQSNYCRSRHTCKQCLTMFVDYVFHPLKVH